MGQETLLNISEASRILGVSEAALRQWTGEGKIKAFVTPSGHRRYSQADLKKLPPMSTEQRESLEAMTRSIVNKILEDPVKYLKVNGSNNHCEMIKELFQLNTERNS